MMTPCEKKGYEVGQVFERIVDNAPSEAGEILVLIYDDRSDAPKFKILTGANKGKERWPALVKVKRVYPPEAPIETIELMGKTYNKSEIEEALSKVKALS